MGCPELDSMLMQALLYSISPWRFVSAHKLHESSSLSFPRVPRSFLFEFIPRQDFSSSAAIAFEGS